MPSLDTLLNDLFLSRIGHLDISRDELAKLAGVSRNTIDGWVSDGSLPDAALRALRVLDAMGLLICRVVKEGSVPSVIQGPTERYFAGYQTLTGTTITNLVESIFAGVPDERRERAAEAYREYIPGGSAAAAARLAELDATKDSARRAEAEALARGNKESAELIRDADAVLGKSSAREFTTGGGRQIPKRLNPDNQDEED